ncbi:beta-galactosidase [Actomonas aquatica]|uniref:Beta-galactosidase n=1 Tax=Actomonas aquatica TaxID=2866162 RepID=A0ABZ1CE14_9BACT|nr:beta-galactosidase [Opitutus sp. WL0086]WRQ89923.1 beta-galactosidase [Opitutus sp. WL0086]
MTPRNPLWVGLYARHLLLASALSAATVVAAPLTLTTSAPTRSAAPAPAFHLGTPTAPDGQAITVDAQSLLLNGARWTPVMGEFHFSRYPANEWAEELRKMKAGGIDIVATYVFWIHHEEIEGQWDWTGQKDLHRFIELAGASGLKVIVRMGPWCHGEVRNGGLPDWVVARGQVRSEDPAFIASTTTFYEQIAAQCRGLLWKDGGPIIGVQLDNEYGGPASYLLALKRLAIDVGYDVPLYTRTGWPALSTPMPFGEIIPLYGVYAEGFWDRETTSMPGRYWSGFHFSKLRIDANIANEALGRRDVSDPDDVADYPYLTCEIGGGMMSSYHRRILVDPADIYATTLIKLGSGSVSPGYYMYHGGTNPPGQLTTLMEQQDSPLTNWNDMPELNYDFQAPLGQYGQTRPHYFQLRLLHAFLDHFGPSMARMDTFLPDVRPSGQHDISTLRWSVRSDGERGFVFVNNHQRGTTLPAKTDVQFAIRRADGSTLRFPHEPLTVVSDAAFILPFGLQFGHQHQLEWATAQPLAIEHSSTHQEVIFVEIPGIPATFKFAHQAPFTLTPGHSSELDHLTITVRSPDAAGRHGLTGSSLSLPKLRSFPFTLERAAGPLRTIDLATTRQPVATAPTAADFADAAIYRIDLPADFDPAAQNTLLRLHYVGDVARLMIGDTVITDDFYNGNPLEIGLRRHAEALRHAPLRLAILPLQRRAVTGRQPLIFLDPSALPDFGDRDAIAELRQTELTFPTTWHELP